MKTNFGIILIFLVLLFNLNGCSQHYDSENRNEYFLQDIDSTTFEKFNLIFLNSPKLKRYYVLSFKDGSPMDKENYLWRKLEVDKKYELHLSRIDTVVIGKLYFIPTRQIEIYNEGSTIIWQQDTFKTDIFMSDEIKGLYILRKQ